MKNTIYSHFHHWAVKQPYAPAVIEEHRTLTYDDLEARSAQVAEALADLHQKRVGIVMEHGFDQIAAIIGVLRSGNAYVPAEPFLPQQRIDYYMNSAGVATIIDKAFMQRLKSTPADPMPDRSQPDGEAYILYTSGTSGKPKGIIVENSSVVNYAQAFENEMHTSPADVMLQLSVCSFDIFVEEVFASLLNGAAIAVPAPATASGCTEEIIDFCNRKGVTEISGFPYLLAEMNKLDMVPRRLRLLISGGDVLRYSYIDRLVKQYIPIYNTYGPSETTVCATYARVDNAEPLSDGTLPIGRPVYGVEVMLLDSHLQPVKPGEKGEICILGRGVARGYVGNPPESRNFTHLPDGRRVYRSGDEGYLLPDGQLAFTHRLDDQVMIMGKRVEPAEVENVLNSAPGVERGVVRSFRDAKGLSYLVAYFVPKKAAGGVGRIKAWLNARLSDFMVPDIFVQLKKIPLTRRGKVDVAALPKISEHGN